MLSRHPVERWLVNEIVISRLFPTQRRVRPRFWSSSPSERAMEDFPIKVPCCIPGSESGGTWREVPGLNGYLHKLDQFVETVLIPEYTRGDRWSRNPAYLDLLNQLAKARRRGDRADDHLPGFIGPKAEAEEIKRKSRGSSSAWPSFCATNSSSDSPGTRR
jgi:hypothetical protein